MGTQQWIEYWYWTIHRYWRFDAMRGHHPEGGLREDACSELHRLWKAANTNPLAC